MKRLLLVSYVFPPAPSPGALRPGYLARYLPRFGWDVTVLTNSGDPPPFPASIVAAGSAPGDVHERMRSRITSSFRNPEAPLRKTLRAIKETTLFPDSTAMWIAPALRAGDGLLKQFHYDAILSTAHPPSAHVIAWILARKSGLPWIADYRDPWAGNAYLRRGPLRTALERLLERGMLHRANALTTISEPIANQLRSFHRRRDVHIIANAFDPADWEWIPPATPDRFELCYTGSLYGGRRSPQLLFEALSQLRLRGDPAGTNAMVSFYGPDNGFVVRNASDVGIAGIVHRHGVVPRSRAMYAQRRAAALLIFLNMDERTASEMGSKYLEYAGAHRPIIAFGPKNSVMRDFLRSSGLGWFASNIDEACEALQAAYGDFRRGTYERRADSSHIPLATDLARQFAVVLDRAAQCCSARSIA